MILAMVSVHASVDLLSPADNVFLRNDTTSFEYYAGVASLTGCSVQVANFTFPDTSTQSNAMNSVQVQGIPEGTYLWNVTCTGATNETSNNRVFTIDRVVPTLALISPQQGNGENIALDMIANDDSSSVLVCNATWNQALLDQFSSAANAHYAKNYTVVGNGTFTVSCADAAGNAATQSRVLAVTPKFGLILTTNKQEYAVGETAQLTVDTTPGANVSIDVCPDEDGFVQCTSAIIASNNFPQTITLPYVNKTGKYVVEGVARYAGLVQSNQTKYAMLNTMIVTLGSSKKPTLNGSINLTSVVSGGIPPYRLVWKLHDGRTVQDVSTVLVTYATSGIMTERVTAYDSAGNNWTVEVNYTISPLHSVKVKVVDNATGLPIEGALVDADDEVSTTISDGYAYFQLLEGPHEFFTSANGFRYNSQKLTVTGAQEFLIRMDRSADVPKVTITAPAASSTILSPVAIKFSLTTATQAQCTLLLGNSEWAAANGSMQATSGAHEFIRELGAGTYNARIDCSENSQTGSAVPVTFTVAEDQASKEPAPRSSTGISSEEEELQQLLDATEIALTQMEVYGSNERELLPILGIDKQIRATRRSLQQAIRDVADLQYRKDLDEVGRVAERKTILEGARAIIAGTPLAMQVTESKTYVKYLKENDLDVVAQELAGVGSFIADAKTLRSHLASQQQEFTVSSKLSHVEYFYGDQSKKEHTVVVRFFTFAKDIPEDYKIYEVIPKEVAKSAKDITMITKGEIVKDDPILRYAQQESVSYVVPKRVDFTRMEDIKTVIAMPVAATTGLTGFAIIGNVDVGSSVGISALIILVLAILGMLSYVLRKHLGFLFYRFGKKEKVHYMRVLIGDATDQLAANNYEKADLLYKEIRLTYDTLSSYAQNDLYDDVMVLVKTMDSYYFNMIMLELDEHLKAGDMDAAIHSYEKLTGTFSRLDVTQQDQLVTAVTAMARRIGLEVA
jgi:hypothetical protein